MGVTTNTTDWPFSNPGNNPFTGSVTFGTTIDFANDTVFSAFGSNPFTTANFMDIHVLETAGSGPTTVSWGGQMLLVGTPNEFIGSRIAQSGMNFDSFTGSVSFVPEPSQAALLISLLTMLAFVGRRRLN